MRPDEDPAGEIHPIGRQPTVRPSIVGADHAAERQGAISPVRRVVSRLGRMGVCARIDEVAVRHVVLNAIRLGIGPIEPAGIRIVDAMVEEEDAVPATRSEGQIASDHLLIIA